MAPEDAYKLLIRPEEMPAVINKYINHERDQQAFFLNQQVHVRQPPRHHVRQHFKLKRQHLVRRPGQHRHQQHLVKEICVQHRSK